jgi:hypothetical protein
MLKAAGVLAWLSGLGFGLPCVYAIWHLVRHGEIARVLGYPTYGEALFERIGLRTTVPLLLAFLLVCVADCAAGWLLWEEHQLGAVLGVALVAAEAVFWIGFALPYGPPIAVARAALIVAGWVGAGSS